MKNVHVIPTDKPSRLHLGNSGLVLCDLYYSSNTINSQHIYITNSEEIKEDVKWIIHNGKIHEVIENKELYISVKELNHIDIRKDLCKKIILTTDQDLIKDGVQAIDDTFLEWFIKNPSCERVEVGYGFIRLTETDNKGYWISTPDTEFNMQIEEPNYNMKQEILSEMERLENEEPKQEPTLEEAADLWSIDLNNVHPADSYIAKTGFIAGAKWQQEKMYSEEDMVNFALFLEIHLPMKPRKTHRQLLEQYKKK